MGCRVGFKNLTQNVKLVVARVFCSYQQFRLDERYFIRPSTAECCGGKVLRILHVFQKTKPAVTMASSGMKI